MNYLLAIIFLLASLSRRIRARISTVLTRTLTRLVERRHRRRIMFAIAVFMMATIAFVDWRVDGIIAIGFLYLIPVMLVSTTFTRTQIVVTALVCAGLQEGFSQIPESYRILRLFFGCIGFASTGLFVSEVVRNRDRILQHAEEMKQSILLREDAEEQLRLVVDTSPAAIVTINEQGEILVANDAAREIFDEPENQLTGQPIGAYLPPLQAVVRDQPSQIFRTALECRGQRRNGESFLAGIWFSTYSTLSGPRLTAIIVDLSDDLVARRTSSLDYTLRNTRILMSGMAHEVRNVCSAMRVIHKNLGRLPELAHDEDFRALDSLLQSLDKISTAGIGNPAPENVSMLRLSEVLDELRVLVDNAYNDTGIAVRWILEDSLPMVRADRFGLVQVFLNLASNSKRAMHSTAKKELRVATTRETNTVLIRFVDSGVGIDAPEKLFRPFQPGTGVTGLGLYVSRTIMRSFGGDLVCEPQSEGTCFAVVLPTGAVLENNASA